MSQIFVSTVKLFVTVCRLTNTSSVYARSYPKYSTKNEASFEIRPFQLHKLTKCPATKVALDHKSALKLYEQLVTIRQMETAASNLYKEKLIRGFCHLYTGQEAVAVGIRSAMRSVDTVITSYRCHAWTYLMGVSVTAILSELTARRTGCSRGKGGSMHMYAPNFFGGNGIVGAQGSLGAGLSFAHKYKSDGGVSFTLYGDGAANQGQLYESYNIAKLWNLPCVFVCENNLYGMGTKADRASASTEYYKRGDYIPGIWVDGMDIIATREAARFAIEYCTSEKGPLVLEVETYRYVGHSMSDPGTTYRTRDEIQNVRKTRDPINGFKEKILKAQLVTSYQLKSFEAKAKSQISEALKHAKSESESGMEVMCSDVYKLCLELKNEIRGLYPSVPLKHISTSKN